MDFSCFFCRFQDQYQWKKMVFKPEIVKSARKIRTKSVAHQKDHSTTCWSLSRIRTVIWSFIYLQRTHISQLPLKHHIRLNLSFMPHNWTILLKIFPKIISRFSNQFCMLWSMKSELSYLCLSSFYISMPETFFLRNILYFPSLFFT